jgi:hypothetical protein
MGEKRFDIITEDMFIKELRKSENGDLECLAFHIHGLNLSDVPFLRELGKGFGSGGVCFLQFLFLDKYIHPTGIRKGGKRKYPRKKGGNTIFFFSK